MPDTYSIIVTGLNTEEESSVSTHFAQLGHKVIPVKSLIKARETLSNKTIDLMYVNASKYDGIEDRLKEIFNSKPSLPVVIVCDKATDDFILNAWRSGAADILTRPLMPQALNDSLHRIMHTPPAPMSEEAAPVPARFFYLDDAGEKCRVNVTPPRFRMGRSSKNDLIIGQVGISREHAEVVVQDGTFLLRNLSQKKGTYVNGVQIEQAQLKDGDRVQLGDVHGTSYSFHTGDLLQSLLGRSDPTAETGLSLYRFKEVGKLFAAFRALSSISVLDDLLALVVDTAIELTDAERGFIMLSEEAGELIFRCARNNNKQPLDGSCFQTSQRVPQDVFKTGRPIVITDLGDDPGDESHNRTRQLGLRSITCVPLRYISVHESVSTSTVAHRETIGVLYVDSQYVGSRISDMRTDALEALASEAAMAIYNARLYKVSQDKRRMDEQLIIAHEIQQALLPESNRELEHVCACSQSLPCYDIGGDFYDYFNLEGGRFGFALGDVAGKGVPAALLASLVQGMFSSQSFRDLPLSDIIESVNRNLVQRGTGNRFVTFFFGILDPNGNCTYVNAGHNPPYVLSRDGSMKELTEGGMVLGLFKEAKYDSGLVALQPGDHLVLFTDGVVEALNSEGEEYGTERLIAYLKANARTRTPEILSGLREEVLSFSAHTPQHDDITMMILGYREP